MELWLPWVKTVGLPSIAVVLLWLAFRVQRAKGQWRVISARAVSVLGALLVLPYSLFLLTAQGCEEDRKLIGSPDGKHVARLMIWGSVPSGTTLRIVERKSWSPVWQEVSSAFTVGTLLDPIEPHITWDDNLHLVIDYPGQSEGSSFECSSKEVGNIQIVCRTHKGQ